MDLEQLYTLFTKAQAEADRDEEQLAALREALRESEAAIVRLEEDAAIAGTAAALEVARRDAAEAQAELSAARAATAVWRAAAEQCAVQLDAALLAPVPPIPAPTPLPPLVTAELARREDAMMREASQRHAALQRENAILERSGCVPGPLPAAPSTGLVRAAPARAPRRTLFRAGD